MKQLKYFLILLIASFISCSDSSGDSNNNEPDVAKTFLVSSYLRGNFYNRGLISSAQLNACTDIICVGAVLTENGDLEYDTFDLFNGEGVTTYKELITAIKGELTGNTTLRLGISGGDYWKNMIASQTAVDNFVQTVKSTISQLQLNGVDLDFEWAENETEYTNYSAAIVALSEVLADDLIFSVTLDPVSYKISDSAISAVTYISLQCYGRSPVRFSYDNYVSSINNLISYGIPADKLVPGIPFYGVTADDSKQTVAYSELVKSNLITSASVNEVIYNGASYVFNGVDMVMKKTEYANSQGYYGVMSWSLGTDTEYSSKWSLLKAIKTSLE